MIISLEDMNRPYSCEQWGNTGEAGIPPILDCGTSQDINPHHVFIGNESSTFPSEIVFDKYGYLISHNKIEEALSADYQPPGGNLVGNQNPTSCPDWILGCINQNACNYNENATYNSGVCIYMDGICETCSGEIDGTGIVVDNDADDDDVCDADEIVDCQDPAGCNYNEIATDPGDCTYAELYYNCNETCINDTDGDTICDELELSIDNELIPNKYSINNIYPNPFNPTTSIDYELPENAYVKIIIYDLSGKYVQTLIDEFQNLGYYNVNLNAKNYPSGIYFVRMISGGFIQTQKIILMK